jgi:hypothetical protein
LPAAATASPAVNTNDPYFGPLTVCGPAQFDEARRQCIGSTISFRGPTKRVYATWPFANIPKGLAFSRTWYLNDQYLFTTPNVARTSARWSFTGEYAFIYIDAQEGSAKSEFGTEFLPNGTYRIELFINDVKVQEAEFTVSS